MHRVTSQGRQHFVADVAFYGIVSFATILPVLIELALATFDYYFTHWASETFIPVFPVNAGFMGSISLNFVENLVTDFTGYFLY